MAEDKIDSEETVRMLVNKKTGESKIDRIAVKKAELFEGVESYKLLQKLATDENANVREEAKKAIQWVDKRLQEKEKGIKEGEFTVKEKSE